MTIEEQIKALMPQMTEQVAAQIRERALANLEHVVASAVTEEVKKYIANVIVPSVQAELAAHEGTIKAGVLAAVKVVAERCGTALVEQMTEKLTGYQGDKLVRDIFGPLMRGY